MDAQAKAAIVIVPGFFSHQNNQTRDGLLIPGLQSPPKGVGSAGETCSVSMQDDKLGGRCIMINNVPWDVYEIAWSDFVDDLSKEKAPQQFVRSLGSSLYWFGLLAWKRLPKILNERTLAGTLMLSSLLLLLWYASTLHTVWTLIPDKVRASTINDAQHLMQIVWLRLPAEFRLQLSGAYHTALSAPLAARLSSWWLWQAAKSPLTWTLLTALLLALKLPAQVNMADFTQRYLRDSNFSLKRPDNFSYVAARNDLLVLRINQRLAGKLGEIAAGHDRIVLVAHSLGCLLTVRLLAEGNTIDAVFGKRPVVLLTLGGMLPFLSIREPAVTSVATECLSKLRQHDNAIDGSGKVVWHDFFSEADWFSSNSGILQNKRQNICAEQYLCKKPEHMPHSLRDQINGVAHTGYFGTKEVQQTLREMMECEKAAIELLPGADTRITK